ncbi:MAG: hypothetical protein EZS28_032893 [Streblomastix strix]|uniref:Uncharacterized protein n=1 Tax=Streblomastix strix TaxID=222440 RepID=A0A5J4UNF8_9EUKA|nr:MAG: hypothetical protein EZS28_032893 [Streblomastix strix]
MEQDDKFQNMMDNMMNKLQGHSNEDEAMRRRMQILGKLSPEEQQRVKRGFGPQLRLTSFYEAQILRKITQQNNNAIQIDTGWDFGSGTGEQQDEFQEDFIDDAQLLEIRPLGAGQSIWTTVQLDELFVTAIEGPRPVKHKTEIEITHQQL